KTARRVAEGATGDVKIDPAAVRDALGPRRFAGEVRKRTSDPGVATGLAVTAVGGDVLFIEATAYPGKGGLRITGQLGEVMQESAQAARSWVRSNSQRLGIDEDWFATHDVHIHVPAGAVPKDGPSAGVTMATALASLVRGEPVSDDVGMTGEITLTGQVLPIGGVREKVLAAQRAGLKRVILPRENEPDLEDLPPGARDLEFVLADTIQAPVPPHRLRAPGTRNPAPKRAGRRRSRAWSRRPHRPPAPERARSPSVCEDRPWGKPTLPTSERTCRAWQRRRTRSATRPA